MENPKSVDERIGTIETKVLNIESEMKNLHYRIDDIPNRIRNMVVVPQPPTKPEKKFKHCYESPFSISVILFFLSVIICISYIIGKSYV